MVLTVAQTTSFFRDNANMGITARTLQAISNEGITDVEDLEDFHNDDLDHMVENFKRPPQIIDPAPVAPAIAGLINQAPFQLAAKSLKRLKVAASAVRYYRSIGRDLTFEMMWWSTLAEYELHADAIKTMKEHDEPDVPKLKTGGSVAKWME